MAVIYKYPLDLGKELEFNWPSSKVLMVDVDQKTGKSCMWVEHFVDPDISQDKSVRKFVVKGTGELFSTRDLQHVASWQNFPFIWHLYEVMSPSLFTR